MPAYMHIYRQITDTDKWVHVHTFVYTYPIHTCVRAHVSTQIVRAKQIDCCILYVDVLQCLGQV